jgi:H-NS histone family protein
LSEYARPPARLGEPFVCVEHRHLADEEKEVSAVIEWEYQKLDLNQQRPRNDELDLLNAAGADGWELIGITSNNIAYLKRPLENGAIDDAGQHERAASRVEGTGPAEHDNAGGNSGHEVKIKYRDPRTNETWTGRGRMANWLKRKQDAGEDIEKYRV